MNQCVFIKGFRAKRGFSLPKPFRTVAGPPPDDPNNCPEDETQVICMGISDDQEVGRPHVVR